MAREDVEIRPTYGSKPQSQVNVVEALPASAASYGRSYRRKPRLEVRECADDSTLPRYSFWLCRDTLASYRSLPFLPHYRLHGSQLQEVFSQDCSMEAQCRWYMG